MTPVSHGKPCAGNPHARFDEGASASEKPRRNALLHKMEFWKGGQYLQLNFAMRFDILFTRKGTECLQQETKSDEKAICHSWHLWLVRRFI